MSLIRKVTFWFLAVTPVVLADVSMELDSTVGKSPFHLAQAPAGSMAWYSGSVIGKQPYVPVINTVPPRSAGPGMRFDTRRYFYIYTDHRAGANHYAPSGWMGDFQDLEMDDASKTDPADGRTCIRLSYQYRVPGGKRWAGMYWQYPEDNWGDKKGGFNLVGMKRVTFWARGENGGETINEFRVGGIRGALPDSGYASVGPVVLSRDWRQYEINLDDVDLRKLSGGFAWAASRDSNPEGLVFYLDEIRYER